MRPTSGACSYGPIGLPPIPAAVLELSHEEQLEFAAELIAQPGTEDERRRQGIAAALRELNEHVPDAVGNDYVHVRLAIAKDPWATSVTLDWMAGAPSWRVRDRVRGTVFERRRWRFIRGLD